MIDDDPFRTEAIDVAQTTLALCDTVVSAEIRQRMATGGAMHHKDLVWPG